MAEPNIAAQKADKLSKLLADLEAGKDVTGDAEAMGAKRIETGGEIAMPSAKFIWVECSGCGCACHVGEGAGKGCGEHAGHWA